MRGDTPAFPFYSEHKFESTTEYGLTKREHIAIEAMKAILTGQWACPAMTSKPNKEQVIADALQIADMMVAAL